MYLRKAIQQTDPPDLLTLSRQHALGSKLLQSAVNTVNLFTLFQNSTQTNTDAEKLQINITCCAKRHKKLRRRRNWNRWKPLPKVWPIQSFRTKPRHFKKKQPKRPLPKRHLFCSNLGSSKCPQVGLRGKLQQRKFVTFRPRKRHWRAKACPQQTDERHTRRTTR